MYILVTGASGFIGLPLVKELSKYKKVIALIRNETSFIKSVSLKSIDNVIVWNIDNLPIEDIFKQYEISGIIHLATYYTRDHKQEDIKRIIDSNVTFPLELLNLGIKYSINWFINTGTGFEYQEKRFLLEETDSIISENLYAQSKVMFDQSARFLLKDKSIPYLNMILFSPYGETEPKYKIISNIINSFLQNKKLVIKNPNQKLDLLYYIDIVDAYIKAINYLEELDIVINDRINLGSNEIFTIKEIVEKVRDVTNSNTEIVYENSDICINRLPNVDRALNVLKWTSKISFQEGLKRMVEFYKQ